MSSTPAHPFAGFGANEWLVDEMYQQFLKDPGAVDKAWWDFFADYSRRTANGTAEAAPTNAPAHLPASTPSSNGSAPNGAISASPAPATTPATPGLSHTIHLSVRAACCRSAGGRVGTRRAGGSEHR